MASWRYSSNTSVGRTTDGSDRAELFHRLCGEVLSMGGEAMLWMMRFVRWYDAGGRIGHSFLLDSLGDLDGDEPLVDEGEIFPAKLLHDIWCPTGHETECPVHVGACADRTPQEVIVGAVGEKESEEIREYARLRHHADGIYVSKPFTVAEDVYPLYHGIMDVGGRERDTCIYKLQTHEDVSIPFVGGVLVRMRQSRDRTLYGAGRA